MIQELTKQDFYNAFRDSEIKEQQTGFTLNDGLMTWEAMLIASEIALSLHQEWLKNNELKQAV